MSVKKWVAVAVAGFLIAGPLQHVGAIPQTVVGDASKASIKAALNFGASEALACNFPGGGSSGGQGGNFGWNLNNTHLGEFISRLRNFINSHRR
jgi:hypothetical protein